MVCYAGLLIKLLAAQLKWQYPYYNMAYSSFRERIIFFSGVPPFRSFNKKNRYIVFKKEERTHIIKFLLNCSLSL